MNTRPDPYTLAREIEARCFDIAARAAYGTMSLDRVAEELDNVLHMVRALRRSMVRTPNATDGGTNP